MDGDRGGGSAEGGACVADVGGAAGLAGGASGVVSIASMAAIVAQQDKLRWALVRTVVGGTRRIWYGQAGTV